MKILVINCGSSSVKCCLYDFENLPKQAIAPLWEGRLDWKNTQEVQAEALENLIRSAPLSSLDEIDVVGHRIVHGGNAYKESVFIDAKVKETIRLLSELAPLHNLADLEGIEVLEKLLKGKPQVAVFDTAFHHTLPLKASVYPGPYSWFENGIRRYGFHGISFQYCSKRAAEISGRDLRSLKMVICHLGSGASLCAVLNGKSIDTTMGFTPLEGLMMDTRCGTIDPGILLYLAKQGESAEALAQELYEESGLLGLSGISSDMRDIIAQSDKNPRAELALDVYIHRLCAMIAAMATSLHGMDALVFTAGIGENAPLLRRRVCESLSFLGVKIDEKINGNPPENDCALSSKSSKVQVLLVHTQEAFEIARECWKIIGES